MVRGKPALCEALYRTSLIRSESLSSARSRLALTTVGLDAARLRLAVASYCGLRTWNKSSPRYVRRRLQEVKQFLKSINNNGKSQYTVSELLPVLSLLWAIIGKGCSNTGNIFIFEVPKQDNISCDLHHQLRKSITFHVEITTNITLVDECLM